MDEKANLVSQLKVDGLLLAEAPIWARDDDDIVTSAVQSTPEALQFASDRLRDSAVVVAAVAQDGLTLRHALGYARQDRDICREAVFRSGTALQYVPLKLRSTLDIALTAVRNCAQAVAFIDLDSLASEGFAEKIAECDPDSLNFMPDEIASRADVVSAAKKARVRISMRCLPEEGVKPLVRMGLERGVLVHQDIINSLPTYALSEHEIAHLADILEYEYLVAVFADERARKHPESSLAWRTQQVHKELFVDIWDDKED